jgi:hypothetical protein
LTESAVLETPSAPNVADVQRRTLILLFISQVAGGVGVAIGLSVAALLTADMVNVGASGLAGSAAVTNDLASPIRRSRDGGEPSTR